MARYGSVTMAIETLLDDPGCRSQITYDGSFLGDDEARGLMESLLREGGFEAEAPLVFGVRRPVRRQSTAYGDEGVFYRYSGLLRQARPWPEALSSVRRRVEEAAGGPFNFVLVNLYPDGEAGLGWHADDEGDLVKDAPIASLSLGTARDFRVRKGNTGGACMRVRLAPGSLLLMLGETQRHYQHSVPKRPRQPHTEPRLNLTFRRVMTGPAARQKSSNLGPSGRGDGKMRGRG